MQETPDFDVAVVGAGCAGIAAALSATRLGARTLLLERAAQPGGNATQALVHTICGLYLPADGSPARHAHPGLPRRLAQGLQAAGVAGPPERAGRVHFLPTHPPALGPHLARLCASEGGLECWLRAELRAASPPREASDPFLLRVQRADGIHALRVQVLIDTSGDAVAAFALGADVGEEAPEALQSPSYIFRMSRVDTSALAGFERVRLCHAVAGAVRFGELPADCESVVVRPAPVPGEAYLTLGVPGLPGRPYTPLDEGYRLALETRARRAAEAIAAFLTQSHPAFKDSQVAAWPARLGIRETRRIRGLVELEREAVVSGARRPDEVAVSTWPIELWADHRRARFEHPTGPCSIPLGSLVSRSHPRLAAAGRCMAGSQAALGAFRVIGTALATGEAAGVAAALAADTGTPLSAQDPERIRARIAALAEAGDLP